MTRIAYVIRKRGIQERSGGNADYGKCIGHRRRRGGIGGGDCGGFNLMFAFGSGILAGLDGRNAPWIHENAQKS